MYRELQAVPDVWSLYEWNNWFTPPGFGKRFDTAFFLCCMEHMEHVSEDAKEVSKAFVRNNSKRKKAEMESVFISNPSALLLCLD